MRMRMQFLLSPSPAQSLSISVARSLSLSVWRLRLFGKSICPPCQRKQRSQPRPPPATCSASHRISDGLLLCCCHILLHNCSRAGTERFLPQTHSLMTPFPLLPLDAIATRTTMKSSSGCDLKRLCDTPARGPVGRGEVGTDRELEENCQLVDSFETLSIANDI